MDLNGILAHSCSLMGFWVMKATIKHKCTRMGYLCRVQFGKRMVTGCYSGTLRYNNLYGYKDLDRRYGEGLMSMSAREIQTYAVHISIDA